MNKECWTLTFSACAYVVRKIRASVADGEQEEKPIQTPCSAKGKKITCRTDYLTFGKYVSIK